MQRRQFINQSLKAGIGTGMLLGVASSTAFAAQTDVDKPVTDKNSTDQVVLSTNLSDPFNQPPLPYSLDALKPFLSAEQLDYHYNKHHASYYANLKKLLKDDTRYAPLTLEEIVTKSFSAIEVSSMTSPPEQAIFNNAAQAWNHAFFWNCMVPKGKGGQPSEDIQAAIDKDLGGMEKFKEDFAAKAVGVFGSGWCWLAKDKDNKLKILPTSNAGCPLTNGLTPLLVVDVWEHAYYVDYRNARANFVKLFLDYINWDYVSKQFAGKQSQ